jgi:hypothetical protein
VGYIEGKSAIHLARTYGERKLNFAGRHFLGARLLRIHLYPHESLVQERHARSDLRTVAGGTDRAHQDRGGQDGLDHRQGASVRRIKKRPPGHRKIARRMNRQDSYRCRECADGHNPRVLSGPGFRRGRGARTSGRHRSAAGAAVSAPTKTTNPATGAGFRLHPGGSTQRQPP